MRLSAPIYRLKQRARIISREQKIPLNQALDHLAKKQGFNSWSALAAQASANTPARNLLAQLQPGDLVLLGARPGHGKTLMSLELIAEAIKQGRRGVFFTLEYTREDVQGRLKSIGVDPNTFGDQFEFDDCDRIHSGYIIDQLTNTPRGSIVVVDYLQLLDQKRENPDLSIQVKALKSYAGKRGLIIVMISQIDRLFNTSKKPFPDLDDVRLPNPLDLALFNKTCFLNNGEIQISATG